MTNPAPDTGIDRRDFGRVTLGAFGAAALASQTAQTAPQKTAAAIKLCVQSPATPSDEQLLFLKQIGAEYVSVGVDAGPAYRRGLHPDQETLRGRGHHGVEHRQHRRPQHAGGHAEPARPRPEDRGVQAVSAQPRQGRHHVHDLRAHGQRHLEQRPLARSAAPPPASSTRPARTRRATGTARAGRAPLARPRVHEGRDLGELHPFHQAGGPGRRRGRRPDRDSPGRPAGAGARRRAALHLQQLRRLQAGPGDRQQPERRDLPLLRHLARRRPQAHGQGSRRR